MNSTTPLLAFYGDDFTGSTDAMEAFTAAGVDTVLFLKNPSNAWVQRFAHMRCIGLAGMARSQGPDWMDANLPQAFASLLAFGAPILQYKVCSTFDSSAAVGSIGRAIDIGINAVTKATTSNSNWSPMVIGVPRLRRYQAFGNLFAGIASAVHRLDRHPTMSRHPITPMAEADLRLHLAQQTNRQIELIDLVTLKSGQAELALQQFKNTEAPVVMLDVIDEDTLARAGQIIWEQRGAGIFTASSSGLQYALVAHWRQTGMLAKADELNNLPNVPNMPMAKPTACIAAVSGSCSPVTAAQIDRAQESGFICERLIVAKILNEATRETEINRLVELAQLAVLKGASPLIYSARGPDDPAVIGFSDAARRAGLTTTQAANAVGLVLAQIMGRIVMQTNVQRIVIAGGDSSGAVASALDIAALTVKAQLVPGAPLCRAWSDSTRMDGVEVVLKGGQFGQVDFFQVALNGLI